MSVRLPHVLIASGRRALRCTALSASCAGLRPSVDLRYIRDHADAVQANIVARGSGAFANALLVKQLYERSLTDEFDVAQMRKARNALTKKFGAAKEQAEKE